MVSWYVSYCHLIYYCFQLLHYLFSRVLKDHPSPHAGVRCYTHRKSLEIFFTLCGELVCFILPSYILLFSTVTLPLLLGTQGPPLPPVTQSLNISELCTNVRSHDSSFLLYSLYNIIITCRPLHYLEGPYAVSYRNS